MTSLSNVDGNLRELVAGEGRLYGVVERASEQLLVAFAPDGASAELVATSSGAITSLETEGRDVYWIDSAATGIPGILLRARAGGAAETLLAGAVVWDATIARGEIYYLTQVIAPVSGPNWALPGRPSAYLSVAPLPE